MGILKPPETENKVRNAIVKHSWQRRDILSKPDVVAKMAASVFIQAKILLKAHWKLNFANCSSKAILHREMFTPAFFGSSSH